MKDNTNSTNSGKERRGYQPQAPKSKPLPPKSGSKNTKTGGKK